MTQPWSEVTLVPGEPPRVSFPRAYNAAVDLVDRHVAQGRGERLAVQDDSGRYTYAQLAERINRAGNALKALGVQPEQRVLLLLHDTVDFPASFLGAMKLGAVPVPLNTMLPAADYAHFVRDSRARVVIASDALLPKLDGVPNVVPASRWQALLAEASPQLEAAPTTPDDVAFWLYSSGSTGAPKGAIHLHAHLVRTAAYFAQGVLGLREDDVVYSASKLFFAYGLGNGLTFPFAVGAAAQLTAERTTPAVVARMMRERRPTVFCGVPTLFAALLADPQFAVADSLRVSTSAGEALPKHVGEAWRARFGSDIVDGIGSTEMLHIFLSNRPGDIRYGTTGRPVPGYELKLVGDDGQPVPDGEEGSLWVRGATAAAGYWNNREKSLETFHGPWTRTGDRYIRNVDGTWVYSGRDDDMLKVGGAWVSPFEVESALSAHPAVLEAAVVGHPDDNGLTRVKAYLVLKDETRAGPELEAELVAFVKTRLPPFKQPRWLEFQRELPKTATGKIQRFKLRG